MKHTVTLPGPVLVFVAILGTTACPIPNRLLAQVESESVDELEVDDSTPEAAIRAFYNALARGDAKAARQLIVSPREMAEWTEIQARLSVSCTNLGTAVISHFGEEGKALAVATPAELALRKLDTLKPIVNGDTAEWPTNPKVPLKMKAVDGHWKLDLYGSFKSPEEHLKYINRVSAAIAAYVGKVATDISDGKFESIADVRKEMKKQREIMNRELSK